MSIGVAIIGSGLFATDQHLPAVKACSRLTLKAIYSRSLKSAKALGEAAGNVDLYSDDSGSGKSYHDLLQRTDIHAVILALPILSQKEFVEAALAAGKHVLSEKPIAGDIEAAEQLIQYYNTKIDKNKVFWGVAENFRFLDSFLYAQQEIQKLGKVLGFRVKMFMMIKPGNKGYETEWRKTPSHQGGFLLDGGVHFVAGTRMLLGEAAKPTTVSAYTTLLQPYLPPVDTVDAIWRTKSGISGTFSVSFGTTVSGSEYSVACEKGSVTVVGSTVTVRQGQEGEGSSTEKDFSSQGSGVKQEVAAWAESLVSGQANPRQAPEEALADLEILEKMLRSGEAQGKGENLCYQI